MPSASTTRNAATTASSAPPTDGRAPDVTTPGVAETGGAFAPPVLWPTLSGLNPPTPPTKTVTRTSRIHRERSNGQRKAHVAATASSTESIAETVSGGSRSAGRESEHAALVGDQPGAYDRNVTGDG
jgi:hypothetical protein